MPDFATQQTVNAARRPSVQHAMEGIIDSSHQLLVDRIELLQLEVEDKIQTVAKDAVIGATAGAFGASAFIALSIALGLFLTRFMAADLAVLTVGLLYGGVSVAAGLAIRARHQAPKPKPAPATEGAPWPTSH